MQLTATGGEHAHPAWDEFLASSPRGQFQQSSGWAQVKAQEGWSAVREYLDPVDPRSGGFQLLWKQSGLVRIGYVSKGPVLPDETEPVVNAALERVLAVARRLRLAAVVVQPPDDSAISSEVLVRHGFFVQPVGSVIRATGTFSLEGGAGGVAERMSRRARQDWRSACRQGVSLTWGTRDHLTLFFGMMCESARRQRQAPNPARAGLLDALWDAFPGLVHLAFAEHSGRKVAGLLMIRQRDRMVFWKKGWNSERPELCVSAFLTAESLVWAAGEGCVEADVVSMSPEIAERILAGVKLAEPASRSRDIFHLRLGAKPKLLPPAHLLVVSPAVRRVVYSGLRWRLLRATFEARVR